MAEGRWRKGLWRKFRRRKRRKPRRSLPAELLTFSNKSRNGFRESTCLPLILAEALLSAATGTDLGDFFQYVIERPVTLPRQKSAMLPIVNQNVEGTKVSIYNESTHAKFPLLGLKFKNSTPLHLMQGPITVFDCGSYAGDARIIDLQPKEERLISYAIDLGMEVEPVADEAKDQIVKIKIVKGVLQASHKVRERKTYNVKNRSEQDRVLLIEHPYRQDFKLLTPKKAAERSRDVYRFEVKVPAGKTAKQEVVEEKRRARTKSPSAISTTRRCVSTCSEQVISEKAKEALQKAMALKAKVGGDEAGDRPARAAIEGHRRGPDPAAGEPQGPAADFGGVQALREEVRRPGDGDRDACRSRSRSSKRASSSSRRNSRITWRS